MKSLMTFRAKRGFILVEIMISIAIIGITMTWYVKAQVHANRLAESEIGLQNAINALRSEVEILKFMPYDELSKESVIFFSPSLKNPENLVAGRGLVTIEPDSEYPDLLILTVEIHWQDTDKGMRTIHAVIYRTRDKV